MGNKIILFVGAFTAVGCGGIPLMVGLLAGVMTIPHILFRLALCALGYVIMQYAQRRMKAT